MTDAKPLRLLAQDAEDLKVISAALQDAVTRIGDIQWEPGARSLTVAFNRFRWEVDGGAEQRIRAGLQIGGVLEVKARNLRRDAKDAVVELLALSFDEQDSPGGVVSFAFADGGDLAVSVECVDAVLADISMPWPATGKPGHEV